MSKTSVWLYRYIGPEELRQHLEQQRLGVQIDTYAELVTWLQETGQHPDTLGHIGITFVIDAAGGLLVADRHMEHVACAGGQPVCSAGELFLAWEDEHWQVAASSNQSTGYCPEPDSWPAVAAALARLPLPVASPDGFTFACIFRRCPRCHQINLIKDGVYYCAVCEKELPLTWDRAADG